MEILQRIMYICTMILFTIIFIIVAFYNKISAIFACLLIIIYFVIRKYNKIKLPEMVKKYFPVFLFIIAFAIRLIALRFLKIKPYSDFAVLIEAAENFKNGINIMIGTTYFEMWGYQVGYVLYQTSILKIFNSVQAIHIIDCFYTAGICVLIYFIGKRFFKKGHGIPSILYMVYMYAIAYTGVLSNQHLFTFLGLISLLIISSDNEKIKFWKYPIAAVIIAVANIIRPEGILFIVAILGYEFLKLRHIKDIWQFLKRIICVLLIYVILGSTASLVVKQFKINETGLKSTNSLWKFVCGLDLNSRGTYSVEGEKIMEDNDKEKQFIIENIKAMKPDEFILLMRDKIKIFWADEAYSWVANNLEEKIYVIGNNLIKRLKIKKC